MNGHIINMKLEYKFHMRSLKMPKKTFSMEVPWYLMGYKFTTLELCIYIMDEWKSRLINVRIVYRYCCLCHESWVIFKDYVIISSFGTCANDLTAIDKPKSVSIILGSTPPKSSTLPSPKSRKSSPNLPSPQSSKSSPRQVGEGSSRPLQVGSAFEVEEGLDYERQRQEFILQTLARQHKHPRSLNF